MLATLNTQGIKMTRTRYNFLRAMIRENGWYALKWMPLHDANLFADLRIIQSQSDWLQERAAIIAYCKQQNIPCNVRHTRRMQ